MNKHEGVSNTSEKMKSYEFIDPELVDRIVTAKGSVYKYLEDGTTQRYKKVESKNYEPQNVLVFMPPFEWLKNNTSNEKLLDELGENHAQYIQTILSYIQEKESKVYVVDRSKKKIETNEEAKNAETGLFLIFGNQEKAHFAIPVSRKPAVDFYTYDSRKFKDEDGQQMRERHLGNKVVEIIQKDNKK